MSNKRRKGKPHRPFVPMNPLWLIQPAPVGEQARIVGRFQSALHMLAAHAEPGPEEWRDLSDAVNTVETMALEMGELVPAEVMPTVNAAITAMAQAGNRHRAGQRMGLSGPGLQAVRDVVDMYAQCLEGLSAATMARAQALTERRIREILAGKKVPGREVIAI